MNLLSLFIIPVLTFGGMSSLKNTEVKSANENVVLTYDSIFEAEDGDYKSCSIINNNPNASGREALDAGDGGNVTFNFTVEEDGYYDLAIGYYTENSGAQIGLTVNGDFESYPVKHINGWCKDTTKYAIELIVRDVELNTEENIIKVASDNIGKSKYLNFDYLRLVKNNEANGERIQFENYYRYVGGDGYGRTYQLAQNADGRLLSLDDNVSAKPVYSINVAEAGTYYLQFAYYSSSSAKYRFIIQQNGRDLFNQDLSIAAAPGGFPNPGSQYFPYSSKHICAVELPEGKVDLTINYIRNGFVDFDWFRIYKLDTSINTVIEAEDVTYGDANIVKHQNSYSFLSNYAVELAQGYAEFKVKATDTGIYRLYVGGYTATPNAYLFISIDGKAQTKYIIPDGKATGWTSDISEKNVFYFNLELAEGEHTIKIKKGGDEVGYNYIDLDYFMVMPDRINLTKIELNNTDKNTFIIDDNAIDFVTDYTLEIKNTSIAKIEGNLITAVGKGQTVLFVKYNINGVEMIDEILVLVEAVDFQDKTQFHAKNTTRTYNGERQFVEVEMPEGWTFSQTGDAPMAGTYVVQITFHHENYLDYVYPNLVTLTIVKGVYEGNDLFADDQKVTYDGEEHQYVASAPSGWTISYSENGFTEIGEYEITVTFSHEFYEDVVKTAKFIIQPETANAVDQNVIPVIITISVIVGVAGLAVAGYFLFKKYKESHEVIK